jgi:hypothetical protein
VKTAEVAYKGDEYGEVQKIKMTFHTYSKYYKIKNIFFTALK